MKPAENSPIARGGENIIAGEERRRDVIVDTTRVSIDLVVSSTTATLTFDSLAASSITV